MKRAAFGIGLLVVGICASPSTNAQMSAPNHTAANALVPAQTRPRETQKEERGGRYDFAVVFDSLSQKYQTAFVCESAPYQPVLSPSATKELQKAVAPALHLSKEQEITATALAFDYDVVFRGDHTVLLLKRYSDPKDLPEITLDEATRFLDTLLKETNLFVDLSNDHKGMEQIYWVIRDLYKDATPEEKARYAKGVRWGDVPRDVQLRFNYSQNSLPLDNDLGQVRHISDRFAWVRKPKSIRFATFSHVGMSFPAYQGPSGFPPPSDIRVVVLSQTMKTTTGGGTAYMPSGPIIMKDGKVANPVPDSTEPTKEEFAAPPKARPACQKTLEQAAQEMNARIAAGGAQADATSVEMPAALAQKTVSLFGAKRFLSPLEETKAIADVYGYRGVLGQKNTATIALPAFHPLDDLTQISAELARLMPAPLFHALRGPTPPPPDAKVIPRPIAENEINPTKGVALYIEAAKRLRVLIEPKIANGKTLPLEDAPPETKDLIAVSSLVDLSWAFRGLAMPRASDKKAVDGRAEMTFTMVQEGDTVKYTFSKDGISGSTTFPVPKPAP